jgi:hypothetical protein
MYPELGPSKCAPEMSRFAKRIEGRLVIGRVFMTSESFGTSLLLLAMLARLTPEFFERSLRQELR